MRNKKYGKQLLSILLAGMLSLNVPVVALAESEEFLASEEAVQETEVANTEAYDTDGDGQFADFVAGDEIASEGEDEQLAGFGDEEEITEAGDELDGFLDAEEEAKRMLLIFQQRSRQEQPIN